jgi:hypothetical protein
MPRDLIGNQPNTPWFEPSWLPDFLLSEIGSRRSRPLQSYGAFGGAGSGDQRNASPIWLEICCAVKRLSDIR